MQSAINLTGRTILVVDDTPANLRLLTKLLTNRQYEVHTVANGVDALTFARQTSPDLILLDIMMPQMDGFETCRQLKADPQTQDIPVIFLSAKDEVLDIVTAFSVGGVDYIVKPFHIKEVIIRVETHLTLQLTRRALERKNQQLTQQNAELDAFCHTVAHDLKNPLSTIRGYLEVLLTCQDLLQPHEIEGALQGGLRATTKSYSIIDSLLLLASVRKGEAQRDPLYMLNLVTQAKERLETMMQRYRGEITLPETMPLALGYGAWVEEIWINYLSNALKYGGSPPQVEVGATPQDAGIVRFWVKDNGNGIAPSDQATLFTEFTRLNEIKKIEGHGLGLSIVRRIADKLGGKVGVESEIGKGSTFWFTLPTVTE